MKCPLLQVAWQVRERTESHQVFDCLKEECAWWSGGWQMCAVLSIMDDLLRLANCLEDIKDKVKEDK